MNHTVEINTYHSPIRDQRHKEYAGEITEESFSTYENKNPRIYFTKMERDVWKKRKDEKQSKEYTVMKGEE